MPSPRSVRCHLDDRTPSPRTNAWLTDLALELAATGPAATAELVWCPPASASPGPPPLRRLTLPAADPVGAIVGRTLPVATTLVGVTAPARSRSLTAGRAGTDGRLVHLVTRTGVSVTVLPGGRRQRLGPTDDVAVGRVPDVCRRLLGLATAPAPTAGIATVTHLWLSRAARLAAVRPGLAWGSVLAVHPFVDLLEDTVATSTGVVDGDDEAPAFADVVRAAADALPPSRVVDWSVRGAEQWSWARLRRQVAAGQAALIADALDPAQAAWMDDAMFARWAMGELPSPSAALDVLDATLHPDAVVRLRSTLGLSSLATVSR